MRQNPPTCLLRGAIFEVFDQTLPYHRFGEISVILSSREHNKIEREYRLYNNFLLVHSSVLSYRNVSRPTLSMK